MGTILVFAEQEGGSLKKTATEILGKAAELAGATGSDVAAVVLGDDAPTELGPYGAKTVYKVGGDFSSYSTLRTAAGIQAAVEASGATVVLSAASYAGKDALPRLAARNNSGLGTECTDLRAEGGNVVGRRPVYAGKAFVDVHIDRSPAFFTVRPNSFPQPSAGSGGCSVEALSISTESAVTVLERKAPTTTTVDLTEAERIVSGGRSLKSQENFDAVIRPLGAALGATVGASRAAVDAGYAPHSDQVGQTGKTVNPQLYIATGISGAIQHLAGMRTSKVIVAINKDPEAPIFEHATYGIVADLFEVCPKLTESFKAALSD
jgi:electron transfer flavoprotein alpha subunit